MGKSDAQKWFPLDVDSWLFGSTRLELAADECAVWIDFLALGAKDNGHIRANVGFPYPITSLAGMLGRPVELVERTIAKCSTTHTDDPNERPKLTKMPDGTLYITNWENYQFSERWVRKVNKMNECPVSSGKPEPCSEKPEPILDDIKGNDIRSHKSPTVIMFDHETNQWIGIEKSDIEGWERAYPACDVELELRQMAQWIISNPAKGHKSRWRMFITNWLKRSQDRGGTRIGGRDRRPSEMRVGAHLARTMTFDEWQRTRDTIERNARAEGMKKVTAGTITMNDFNRRIAEIMTEWDRDHPKPGGAK